MNDKVILSNELYKKNEQQSCLLLSIADILFSFVTIIFFTLNFTGVLKLEISEDNYVLIVLSILGIVIGILPWLIPNKYKTLSYILFGFLFVNICILDYTFSYTILVFALIPCIISTRFYNTKITIISIAVTIVALFIGSLAVYLVAINTPGFSSETVIDINWFNFGDVMFKNFFIKILMIFPMIILCIWLSLSGKNIIDKQASMTVNAKIMEKEIQTASEIQQQVLPKDFVSLYEDGISMYAVMKPAKECAGDFYDFFKIKDNVFFLVGDVSDKGLYAAMFMMNVKNIICSLAVNSDDFEQIMTEANKLVCKDNNKLMYVTIWIGCVNTKTKKFSYINAGHAPALIKRRNGDIEILESKPQPFIGVFPDYKYQKTDFSFEIGDNILLYTDGVTDSQNNIDEMFGVDRLINVFKSGGVAPFHLCKNVLNSIYQFSRGKELFDDITLLSLSLFEFSFDKTFSSESRNIELILDDLRKDLSKHNCPIDIINNISSAIDDVLDNVISYAYDKIDKGFRFQYLVIDHHAIFVCIDQGVSFNPLRVKPVDLSPDRSIGGLGIHLIKNIMTEVKYTRNKDKNILFMWKEF